MRILKRPPCFLPSVSPKSVHKLPKKPGIYYCLHFGKVKYVGRSVNIRSRWQDHHKMKCLTGPGWSIAYRLHPSTMLEGREWEEIRAHAPLGRRYPELNLVNGDRPSWWGAVEKADFLADSAVFSIFLGVLYFALVRSNG